VRRRAEIAVLVAVLVWAGAIVAAVRSEFDKGSANLSRAKPLPGKSCPGLVVGVDSSFGSTDKPPGTAPSVAAIQKTLHAQVVRVSLLWNQVEPVKGTMQWGRLDSIVSELRAAGIEPLLVVVGSPSWANGVPASKPGHDVYVPARGRPLDVWLQNYTSFLAAAVKRYDRFVRRWEIWTEPNVVGTWRPRPDPVAYRQVYERLRAAILTRQPNAQVAVGGLGDLTTAPRPDLSGIAFLRDLIRARTPIGNVAIHPSTTDGGPPDVHVAGRNNFGDIAQVHKLLVSNGVRASLWVTGWGWSSTKVGSQRQEQYVDRSLTLLENSYPYVRLATYVLDHDLPPSLFQGLLNARLQPKPAAFAFRVHADLAAVRCHEQMGTPAPSSPAPSTQTTSAIPSSMRVWR